MLALFECVAQAVKDKGLRGLCEMVPAGPYVFDVANHAYKLYRDRKRDRLLKEEIAKAAAAGIEEAKRTAEEVARRVAGDAPIEERLALELYLTQIPGAVRQSLKRADDPSGKTVPPDLALDAPEDLARLLPLRAPYFRPGSELPGRPGWRLDELLGAGGFGEVWLARHSFLPHRRAVKFCTDPKVRAKLTSHEGRVIARVMEQGAHPNVVPLLDAVLDGDTPWLMYEYVGGGCLTDLILKWQSLPEADREAAAVRSLSQLAEAVGTFHRLAPPIVHRDLKPANILLAKDEGQRMKDEQKTDGVAGLDSSFVLHPSSLRITDFGIGGVAVEYLRSNPGGVSLVTGWLETSMRGSYTPLYASPQQARGAAPDPRDDVHALGVIGFQMLTGKLSEAPSPRFERELRRRGVSDALIELIGDCVDSEPTARPKDAAALAGRLAEVTRAAKKPTPPAPLPEGKGEKNHDRSETSIGAQEATRAVTPFPSGRGAGGVGPLAAKGPLDGNAAPAVIAPPPPPTGPTKWLVPLRGLWFARADGAADWALSKFKLPGDVTVKPGEAYRLALNPETTDDDLARLRGLSGLPGLEAIDLSGCARVTDAGLMHLAHLRGLKAVGLADTRVTDSGVTLLLTRFPDLEALALSGTSQVTQTVVPYLARMRKLKLLALPPRANTVDVRVEFAKRRPACQLV
jgi:serine/threonine protein kinase